MRNAKFLWPLLAVLGPYILFELFKSGLLKDFSIAVPMEHFYIVSLVSILASVISIAIGITGRRLRNIKVTFLSFSYFSLALMFSIHGMSTPHFIHGYTHLPGISAQLSMLFATFWMWMSSLPTDNKVVEFLSKRQSLILPVWIICLSIFCFIGMMDPQIVDIVPFDSVPMKFILTVVILALNGMTIYRYYQSYRFSQFPLQISIVYSAGWILVSQLIMVRGTIWNFSWWIYHFLLLFSMIVMIIGLVKQYAVKETLTESIRSLFTNDPFERAINGISPSVKELVSATEKKDTYTAGHTFRVTMYALNLARELNLNPEELRAIVQGGLVHDVGKINIPDSILNKPGKLLPDERMIIEKHPVFGFNLCKNLGFMKEELSIIRSHHEKWDGSGYPDNLKGNDIPFFARIMAVADVYDALTSERSYRKPWTHQEAMQYLNNNKGTHFDPKCVEAWEKLCIRNPEVYQYPSQTIKDQSIIRKLSSL